MQPEVEADTNIVKSKPPAAGKGRPKGAKNKNSKLLKLRSEKKKNIFKYLNVSEMLVSKIHWNQNKFGNRTRKSLKGASSTMSAVSRLARRAFEDTQRTFLQTQKERKSCSNLRCSLLENFR